MPDRLPLVVVHEERLLDEVLRLAAAADCEIECSPDLCAARAPWPRAPLVILDEPALQRCTSEGLPRRGAVMVVCREEPEPATWRHALSIGVEQVVRLPQDEAVLVAALADVAETPSGRTGLVVAVLGGRGGAGSSVFAAGVAMVSSRSGPGSLLLDCDRLGGGLDLLLGAENAGGLRWPDLTLNSGRVSMSALWEALPDCSSGDGRLALLSCSRDGAGPTPDGVATVTEAGRRSGCTVVCDLPRVLDACGKEVLERADLAVVVVPAEVRASAAARVIAEQVAEHAHSVGIVVRGPAPDALPADAVAAAVGLPLLAVMRAEARLDRALDRAEFHPKLSGPLAVAARHVLAAVRPADDRMRAA